MAHRAGTGDAPIPGLITSRRNPAYRLKPRPKEQTAPAVSKKGEAWRTLAANPSRRKRSRSRSQQSPRRTEEEERRNREQRENEERVRQEEAEELKQRKRRDEEELLRRRWAEQEAKWAEERQYREEQRRNEEQRIKDRKNKLKGAFAMMDELSDADAEDKDRVKELAERQKRKAAGSVAAQSNTVPVLAAAAAAAPSGSASPSSLSAADKEDAVKLRAALADPSAPRHHAPGEVAEHFRRLSEMKRRFRRAEFGGPDKKRELSRSRSRDKYNSVWIRPSKK